MIKRVGLMGLIFALMLTACRSEPARQVNQGDELFSVAFDNAGDWEEGIYSDEASDSSLAVRSGRFFLAHQAIEASSFTWSAGGEAYENVAIEVNTEQISREENNLYGVGCRLAVDDRGDVSGYALLISGDGHYGLAKMSNRSLTFILKWHQSGEINQGQAANTIRAVCVDDYLALYVNGEFVGDVTDNTYRRAGQVGFITGVTEGGDINIGFDNLSVYEGTLD